MSTKQQITTHYADGQPSETHDMTDEELANYEALIADSHAVPNPE
jgi:hypothetical protein